MTMGNFILAGHRWHFFGRQIYFLEEIGKSLFTHAPVLPSNPPNKEAGWFFAQLVVVSKQQGIAMVLDIILECHLCFIKHRRKQLNIVSDVILQFLLTVVSQIASEMTKMQSNHI